jgi:hypothetical protein
MRLTRQQKEYLRRLDAGPMTTRDLVDSFGVSRAGFPLATIDQVRSAMRRLEDRELVRRTYPWNGSIHWELTKAGRRAIAEVVEV